MRSGIYQIRNTINGDRYIGSAVNIGARCLTHLRLLERGAHHSIHLQRAFAKHGHDAFRFQTLLICSASNLLFYEQRAIESFLPAYNIAKVAGAPMSGRKHRPEVIEKFSASLRGLKRSPEIRSRMSAAFRGLAKSPEHRAKLSALRKGHPLSLETRAKMSAARLGHKATMETRAKIAETKIGNKNCLGRKYSTETLRRMSESQRGRTFTSEHLDRLSVAQSQRWAMRRLLNALL